MSRANPLWGAQRIHGELLKLGIEISQATVAKYVVRRPHRPSPTWRGFLRNHADGIAAIDMFVVPSATFRVLFVMLILAHDRRKVVRFDVRSIRPQAGCRAKSPKPSRGILLLAFCCAIAMHRRARDSAAGSRRWELPKSSRRHAHHGKTPTSRGSSARSAESVWITLCHEHTDEEGGMKPCER
jgi:hypothetical protein